ncbi:N(2)-acetyl-L-2,4-diaminobutanoate deacetylase DoeB [Marivibrio halodurans]|uniref:N(2)-acetyl-L-2,4-diaminobutanoate deacetylase DoeB n=1 Tax=Marivibrio halodurans TaxID=2039722 RepID=A0A8J7RXL7_9PROT|nr:N(2)-acetyl-L-2,4-diaminobutanoate deacetylase DoeB [Marivibrio halodurans]MBP5856622.1 N(2)-acetyl-L-2,4-diaminobutanoate deacetylase DoeB [Marivibrio halodurans]
MADDIERVSVSIDIEAEGVRHGYLSVPYSHDESAWGAVRVPVATIRNGDGPTVLFTAGNHGDEYEGQIALHKLVRELAADPGQLSGRVIVLPALNAPAVTAGKRTSPIDGGNMNRSFPGDRYGTVTPMIADFVYRHLVPAADAVVDLHSGGRTLSFLPFAAIHDLPDADQRARSLAAMKAFGAPYGLIMTELDSAGMLDTAVEAMGKIFVTTELAGGGTASAETVAIADRGVRNILKHFGMIAGTPDIPGATRFMDMPEGGVHVADDPGLFEIAADLGAAVSKGDLLARIYPLHRTDLPATEIRARIDGVVLQRHFPGLIKVGDCLMILGRDMD